jgi:hypothetical protein
MPGWIFDHIVTLLVALVLTSLVAYPLVIHLTYGWERKAHDIMSSISDKSPRLYFMTFHNTQVAQADAGRHFRDFYHRWYGRRLLFFPMIIILSISAICAHSLGETSDDALMKISGSTPITHYFALPLVATAAIMGAYAFVAWDIVSGVAKRNLSSSDILGAAIRLSIAIPLGYSLGFLLAPRFYCICCRGVPTSNRSNNTAAVSQQAAWH